MASIKVSIFQKALGNGLNLSFLKRLAALKSDFLVFPEYFYADSNVTTPQIVADRSQAAQDWLLKLNDVYRGVIIGGSVVHEESGGKRYVSIPIVSEGSIVDYGRKCTLTSFETKFASKASETGVFILGGQRFATLAGEDLLNAQLLGTIQESGIRLVFAPYTFRGDETVEADEKAMSKLAGEFKLHIVRCCGVGKLLNEPIRGRSMIASPTGITWRVGAGEEDSEILKTLMLNIAGV